MLKTIAAPSCTLGENPLWRADTHEFYWTDIVNGTIYAWNPSGQEPARIVLSTSFQTGAFLFTRLYDLILFTEKGVFISARSGDKYSSNFRLLWEVPFAEGERFNDAICDPYGRILAGSKKADNCEGALHCFEPGKSPKSLLKHLSISNGMGFSPDGTIFYHTDSGPGTITSYHYTKDGLSDKIGIIYQTSVPDAVPDGMTIDCQGNIWTALWGGHAVLQLSPKGEVLNRFNLNASQVSSVCFGGINLNHLLITSASIDSDSVLTHNPIKNQPDGLTYLLSDAGVGKGEYIPGI